VELREHIFETVKAAGFDRVGCLPLSEAGDAGVRDWIAAGHHGTMGYLERMVDAKERPDRAFPDFRTIVVAVLDYGESIPPHPDPKIGNISRYALGDDYHDVMKRRLLDAADRLRAARPGLATRAFVDTGPVNEKLVASRAGLGFVGKHTNLIDHARGSYFFLGLLLLDVDLPPTGPEEPSRCGLCVACIPACPTGAIIAPYSLDARRCISYLTIEHRGAIPRDLRPFIGHRIFGCDDCQEVCPWNRFAQRDPPEPFRPRDGLRTRSLEEWLALDEVGWRRTFRRSAVKRAGYLGFLRNVLVSVGGTGDPTLARAVIPFLSHPSALLRLHAVWALSAIGGAVVQTALVALADREEDEGVREELLVALSSPLAAEEIRSA
jgi:epoxyqueuosine reductase